MQKSDFNEGWECWRKGDKDASFDVTIPHDAMLLDSRSEDSAGGENTGWIDANDYVYEKTFTVPEHKPTDKIFFEFEGIYHKSTIYINDQKAAFHDYGYTGFYVNATDFLREGDNVIRVEVTNSDQANSRWYSGTGIYRPAWMYIVPQDHIRFERIFVTTEDYKSRSLKIEVGTVGDGEVEAEILDGDAVLAHVSGSTEKEKFTAHCMAEGADLWSPDHPKLYTCRVTFGEDTQEVTFGIRQIECTPTAGFCINGEQTLLKGCCVHHDNGLLGACAYDFAERRKIKILLDQGYNAIRSAHNPCSKAMLKACDELGMLVMDEYVDMWYIHKNKYDYASEVTEHYKDDFKAIVSKDYNHPSVILYCTGNEVSETAQKSGIKLCGDMTKYLHHLDPTRPVTCAINIFFNWLSSMGMGVYSDKKADQDAAKAEKKKSQAKEEQEKKKKKSVGSEFYNNLAGAMGSGFMKTGATMPPCDSKTKGAYANMDVAGYNYGIKRYKHDLKEYPERIILGSETFCEDEYEFMEIAKDNPRIIGDFVWSGPDYLGELGIGAWEYEDYAPDFDHGVGWVAAGAGRIDLTGKPLAEMAYTRVAYGIQDIGLAVVPVNHTNDSHSPSSWKMSNGIESWSWNGCDGMPAKVEIYARAAYAELYLNGEQVGKKNFNNDCKLTMNIDYKPGELKAIAYDKDGNKLAETSLITAGEETMLRAEPELDTISNHGDLAYVRFRYTDENGETKPLERADIKINVEGGKLLGFGSACPYYTLNYQGDTADTYYGEALAIIKPTGTGKIKVEAESGLGNASAEITVTE